jgi:hypothetical protein
MYRIFANPDVFLQCLGTFSVSYDETAKPRLTSGEGSGNSKLHLPEFLERFSSFPVFFRHLDSENDVLVSSSLVTAVVSVKPLDYIR